MTEIKCIDCTNYHKKEGFCTISDEHEDHGMDVNGINKIWGITFQECKRYEVKDDCR